MRGYAVALVVVLFTGVGPTLPLVHHCALMAQQEQPPADPHAGQPASCSNHPNTKDPKHDCACHRATHCEPPETEDPGCSVYCRPKDCHCRPTNCETN